MRFSVHLGFSILLAALFFPIFGWNSLLILVGGVLIDADHYIYYVFKFKKFNPFECNKYFTEDSKKSDYHMFDGLMLVFHTLEFLIVMIVLSFYSKLALALTIGIASHHLLDFIWLYFFLKRFILNHSLIWWLIKSNSASFK